VRDLARQFEAVGIAAIIYTDINRDGMMGGINLPATLALSEIVEVPIIASGGVNTLADIEALVKLPQRAVGGIQGVITGRAIYEGTMDLREAITLSQAP
jgi:phosphoribosylformimino-5-aminoimidazole carboxamide ribotide isomerase